MDISFNSESGSPVQSSPMSLHLDPEVISSICSIDTLSFHSECCVVGDDASKWLVARAAHCTPARFRERVARNISIVPFEGTVSWKDGYGVALKLHHNNMPLDELMVKEYVHPGALVVKILRDILSAKTMDGVVSRGHFVDVNATNIVVRVDTCTRVPTASSFVDVFSDELSSYTASTIDPDLFQIKEVVPRRSMNDEGRRLLDKVDNLIGQVKALDNQYCFRMRRIYGLLLTTSNTPLTSHDFRTFAVQKSVKEPDCEARHRRASIYSVPISCNCLYCIQNQRSAVVEDLAKTVHEVALHAKKVIEVSHPRIPIPGSPHLMASWIMYMRHRGEDKPPSASLLKTGKPTKEEKRNWSAIARWRYRSFLRMTVKTLLDSVVDRIMADATRSTLFKLRQELLIEFDAMDMLLCILEGNGMPLSLESCREILDEAAKFMNKSKKSKHRGYVIRACAFQKAVSRDTLLRRIDEVASAETIDVAAASVETDVVDPVETNDVAAASVETDDDVVASVLRTLVDCVVKAVPMQRNKKRKHQQLVDEDALLCSDDAAFLDLVDPSFKNRPQLEPLASMPKKRGRSVPVFDEL